MDQSMMVRTAAALLFLTLTGCASRSAAQGTPAAPETEPPPFTPGVPAAPGASTAPATGPAPSAPPAGTSPPAGIPPLPGGVGDRAGVEADFAAAKARFDRGDGEGARPAFEALVARRPLDPLRPAAQLLLARLALIRGEPGAARSLLEPLALDLEMGANARYFLGLAELRLGQAARAKELLQPFFSKATASTGNGTGVTADEATLELFGALAEANAATGDAAGAIGLWDGYFRAAREHERAFARMRAEQLAAQIPGEGAWRAFGAAPQGGLARAVLGPKAAAYLRGQNDPAGAAFVEGEAARARRAAGFDESGQRVGPGDPTRVGLALPLSGKFQPVGEAALRAAMLALGSVTDAPLPTTTVREVNPGGANALASQLVIRDTATDPDRAARGVMELTREEAVIGIVGSADKRAAAAALAEATQDGIPLLTLDDQAPGALSTGFQLIHAPEARVAELARRALKLGVREAAILGPDSASGKRLREAFRKTFTAGGGKITVEATYVAGVNTFSTAVAALKKAPFQAVFVPDSADRLELIAPALAFADLWPQPWTGKSSAKARGASSPRHVLLLSTANDLSPRLLQNAGRYVQGALLSPGFFADDGDDRSRSFVEAYRAAYGQDPHATEAYAYDGVRLLRGATETGARTRSEVLKALAAGSFSGLTGTARFGPDHGRVDPPLVYVVDGDAIKTAP
jgi:ABC-type branched-subunit amino acid transport system substrate-binding protein